MCELFAMSSRKPTAVTYSLDEFSRNGSKLRHNRDGWGIAFARDRDALLVKEPHPASDSAWVKFIADHSIKTTAAIAHVRQSQFSLPHNVANDRLTECSRELREWPIEIFTLILRAPFFLLVSPEKFHRSSRTDVSGHDYNIRLAVLLDAFGLEY